MEGLGGRVIALGDVFYLRCTHCNPPKQKFYVVAQALPLRMFLINSELTDLQKNIPAHVAACPLIHAADHPFLRYDSYLACDHVSHEYNYEQLSAKFVKDPGIKVGSLGASGRAALSAALTGNFVLPTKYAKQIRPLWP